MAGFTLKDEVRDDLNGWQDVLTRILAVPSYKKFFEVTSQHSPVVVPNNPTYAQSSDRNKCHLNCKNAEVSGLGKQISGWYLVCDLIYKEFPVGLCRLIHHSNILLTDGSLVNPTNDENRTHHIFIRDDKRHFNFSNNVGYNDRMIFGDDFMKGKQATKAIPRNKIHFASNQYFDRNLVFEKFKVYDSKQEVISIAPQGLTKEESVKWITLKTNVNFD